MIIRLNIKQITYKEIIAFIFWVRFFSRFFMFRTPLRFTWFLRPTSLWRPRFILKWKFIYETFTQITRNHLHLPFHHHQWQIGKYLQKENVFSEISTLQISSKNQDLTVSEKFTKSQRRTKISKLGRTLDFPPRSNAPKKFKKYKDRQATKLPKSNWMFN